MKYSNSDLSQSDNGLDNGGFQPQSENGIDNGGFQPQSENGTDNGGFQLDSYEDNREETTQEYDTPQKQAKDKYAENNHERKEEDGTYDIPCGIGSCTPPFLQCCKNMVSFSAVLSISGLVTSALNVYITSQITVIERQFNFSSSISGVLLACNDLGYVVTTLFMSYYTRRVHIPRAMALSTLLYGVSGILCAVAYFDTRDKLVSPPKESGAGVPTVGQSFFAQTCQNFTTSTNSSCDEALGSRNNPFGIPEHCREIAIAIIAVGMILQGVAKSPRQPFVVTYIDDNVPKIKTSLYLGAIIGISFFGPALAFGLGAVFSNMYITLEETSITPRDPRWLGAWWLGFVIFGAAGVVVGLPLIFFPKRMRGQKDKGIVKVKKNKETLKLQRLCHDAKGLLKAMLHLALNPVYIFMVLSNSVNIMGVSGMLSFYTKYLETQFMVTTAQASLTLGILNILAACIGTMISGCLTSKLKWSPLTCVKFLLGIHIVVTVLFSLGLVIGCKQPVIHMNSVANSSSMEGISECVQDCNCDDTDYFPICGSDGRNYFSPCHAGCLSMDGMIFTNCTCLTTNETKIATGGLCMTNCSNFYPYLAILAIGAFISTIAFMPSFIALMRSVKEEDKPFAVGFSAFAGTLIGWFPGPVIFGSLVDSTCILWRSSCGSSGACSLYNIELFRFRFHILIVGLKLISAIFMLLVVIFAVCSKKTVFQPNTDDISIIVTANGKKKGIVTKSVEAEFKEQHALGGTETYI